MSTPRARVVYLAHTLAVGGAVIFAAGIALSVYRDKLLQLPDHIAKREGIFRILNWR